MRPSEVRSLERPRHHVRITSGLCMGSSDPQAIGRWLHFVTYVDEDGAELGDYVGPSFAKAGRAAIDLAQSFSCRIRP